MANIPLDLLIEISENKHRKDYSPLEMIAIKRKLDPYFKEEAKKRQVEHGGTAPGRSKQNTSGKFPEVKGQTRDKIASFLGVSGRTLEKIEDIVEAAESDPDTFGDILEAIDTGKTSISHAHTKVKRRKKHKNPEPLPEGEWSVIMADPPWPYYLPLRGAPDAHYKRMENEEILEMKIPSAEDAVLFLWATNPQLEFAIEVMNSWNFGYRTNLVWVKDIFGTGHYFRGQHELLLLGIRGNIPPPMEEVRFSSVLTSPRRKHSEKPEEIYEIIEVMYPNREYLELFARPTSRRKNWTYWGLGADG